MVDRDDQVPEKRGRAGSAAILEKLQEMILSGELKPGEVVSQTELARQLGVSTTPLREVIRELQAMGLMTVELNRRPRVTPLDISDMQGIYVARIMLEGIGIIISVPNMTEADHDALQHDLELMDAAEDDSVAWNRAHAAFHRRLIVDAPSTVGATIHNYFDRSERYRRLLASSGARRRVEGQADHRRIVEACLARDPYLAASELARHLAHTALALVSAFAPDIDPRDIREAVRVMSRPSGATFSLPGDIPSSARTDSAGLR
jgi:DNA-binding GntR family transcriptional regulator